MDPFETPEVSEEVAALDLATTLARMDETRERTLIHPLGDARRDLAQRELAELTQHRLILQHGKTDQDNVIDVDPDEQKRLTAEHEDTTRARERLMRNAPTGHEPPEAA